MLRTSVLFNKYNMPVHTIINVTEKVNLTIASCDGCRD